MSKTSNFVSSHKYITICFGTRLFGPHHDNIYFFRMLNVRMYQGRIQGEDFWSQIPFFLGKMFQFCGGFLRKKISKPLLNFPVLEKILDMPLACSSVVSKLKNQHLSININKPIHNLYPQTSTIFLKFFFNILNIVISINLKVNKIQQSIYKKSTQ